MTELHDLHEWLRDRIVFLRAEAEHGVSDDTPSEVLAQCEAHTAILDRYEFVLGHGPARDDVRALDMTTGAASALADVVRMVGLAYQHHFGYRPEWRP